MLSYIHLLLKQGKSVSHAWGSAFSWGLRWWWWVSGMHVVQRGRTKRGILYQLAWGIQPIQTWLPWFPLFTLKSPETLFAKMTSPCYWERGGRTLTPVSILDNGLRGWDGGQRRSRPGGSSKLWIQSGYDRFNSKCVIVPVGGQPIGLFGSVGSLLSRGALVLVGCSKWPGGPFPSSQLKHTNGQGASNPGAPCSPFSPFGPFLPFFPFSPCGYNEWVTMTSLSNVFFLTIRGHEGLVMRGISD